MRESFRLQLLWQVGIIDELIEMRMSGAVVEAAGKRVKVRWALELARQDGHRTLAWFLARYLATIRPEVRSRR
jgi:hypothetical protein